MALKARKQTVTRQQREAQAVRTGEGDPLAEVTGRELLAAFDEELQSLPECERVALKLRRLVPVKRWPERPSSSSHAG